MTVALANTPPTAVPVDAQYLAFETGFLLPIVIGASVTASGNTAVFSLPYITVGGKAKLILNISGLTGGSSPGLAVSFNESVDNGTSYNSSAALSIASQTANGTYYSAVATGPIFNAGQLQFTVVGGPSALVASVWLAAWNR